MFILFAVSMLLTTGFVFAANNTSNSVARSGSSHIKIDNTELKKFSVALHDVDKIAATFRGVVHTRISKSPLSQKRFFQIYNAQRSGKNPTPKVTGKESKEYKSLAQELNNLQRSSQQSMVKKVKEDGFTVARFNQIIKALHSDPSLVKRLKSTK
jgi:cell division protein FtsX